METLKQAAITAISQLPDTAKIDDIIVVLYQMKIEKTVHNQTATETKPVSCLDLMKDYIGCIEDAPKDLSTAIPVEKEPISFLEAAKDFIGSLEGPEDLSTNKAYMKGYGQ